MIRSAWVALAMICSVSVGARAQEQLASWEQTFTPQTLAPLTQAGVTRVIVVAAGAQHVTAREAATVIEAQLRALGLQLVMTDEGLGSVATLDDVAIVQRAATLPVDHALIVRAFLGAAGAPASVVIALYAKDSTRLLSLSGARGQASVPVVAPNAAVEADPVVATPPAPVSATTTAAPAPTSAPSASDDAQRQYDEQYIGFVEGELTYRGRPRYGDAYRGKFREPIGDEELYLLIERPDLAERYRKRSGTQGALLWIGLGAVGAGALIGSVGLNGVESCDFDDDACRDRYNVPVGVGLVTMLAGAVMLLAVPNVNVHPVSASERRRLADDYNQRLRQRLGLPALTTEQAHASRTQWSWRLQADARSAGGALRLDF